MRKYQDLFALQISGQYSREISAGSTYHGRKHKRHDLRTVYFLIALVGINWTSIDSLMTLAGVGSDLLSDNNRFRQEMRLTWEALLLTAAATVKESQ